MVAHVQRQGNAVTTMDVIAVVLLNMADDVQKTRAELESLRKTLDQRHREMIARIDACKP